MEDKAKGEYLEQIKLLKKRIAELEISDSERKQQRDIRFLATVVRDSDDAITIQDFEGRITAWNRGAGQMYGYNEKEALGMSIEHLTPPGNVAEHKELTRRLIAGEAVTSFETRRVAKDGRILDVWLTVTKVMDDTGKPIGIASTERDITERKKAEEKLSQALEDEIRSREIATSMLEDNNRIREELERKLKELKQTQSMLVQSEKLASLGKLVADMAHEVNNPLMIISGNAQLSLLDGSLNEELKNNLRIIHEECNRAKNIIQRLLMFSRPGRGEQKPLDINRSIESVVKLLEHQFGLSNVKMSLQFAKGLPRVVMDEKQFQEVVMNLVSNARDAMPEGGEIAINTSLDGAYLKAEIKDSGVGMDDMTLARIFEPFFTTKEKGTGLGLSICYGIIKGLNGKIQFDSRPQKGTTVRIWLPIAGEAPHV